MKQISEEERNYRKDIVNYSIMSIEEHRDNVFICGARRSGKTQILCDIIDQLNPKFKILIVTGSRTMGEIIKERLKRNQSNVKICSRSDSLVRARRGTEFSILDSTVVVVDEATLLNEKLIELIQELILSGQKTIMTITPEVYERNNVPVAKKIWDRYPAVKFSLNILARTSGNEKFYTEDEW